MSKPVVEPTNEFLWYVSGSSICEPDGTIAENLPKEVAELIVRTHNQEIEAFCRAALTPVPVVAATSCPHCNHALHKPGLCDFGLADGECPCDDSYSPVSREPLKHASDCEGCPDCKPDEICSKCGDYFGDHPKYRGITTCEHKGYRREPISAERWLRENYNQHVGCISDVGTLVPNDVLVELLEAYAHSLTTRNEEK